MKKQYTIDTLYASAWQAAISNVAEIVGISKELWSEVECIARKLKIRFDENGEII